jgi:hypothetical protein
MRFDVEHWERTTAGPNKFTERRCRRFVITNRQLVAIFNGRAKIDDEALPEDAEVGHVVADITRDSIVVFVYSDTYPSVPDVEVIPEAGGIGLRMYHYAEGQ